MGMNFHEFCFLLYARKRGEFGSVAMLGRQEIHLHTHDIQQILPSATKGYHFGQYCEQLLESELGACSVVSFDASDYEGATFVSDFNRPIEHPDRYDTVLDLGSCEHVFDVAQALRNVASLCAVGGQIIHSLPADNLHGHGFWQFSAQVFFSLYSEANGFAETEVILTETRDRTVWYRVRQPPAGGNRFEVGSRSAMYALVRTRKVADVVRSSSSLRVQQSDYVHKWAHPGDVRDVHRSELPTRPRKQTRIVPLLKRILAVCPPLFRMVRRTNNVLNNARYQIRSPRYLENRPDLFEELTIADVIR
jgi:hypothetical protein